MEDREELDRPRLDWVSFTFFHPSNCSGRWQCEARQGFGLGYYQARRKGTGGRLGLDIIRIDGAGTSACLQLVALSLLRTTGHLRSATRKLCFSPESEFTQIQVRGSLYFIQHVLLDHPSETQLWAGSGSRQGIRQSGNKKGCAFFLPLLTPYRWVALLKYSVESAVDSRAAISVAWTWTEYFTEQRTPTFDGCLRVLPIYVIYSVGGVSCWRVNTSSFASANAVHGYFRIPAIWK
ncbi:hypothetical protein GGI35DRAFT_29629 [Trichoderma velutinum]